MHTRIFTLYQGQSIGQLEQRVDPLGPPYLTTTLQVQEQGRYPSDEPGYRAISSASRRQPMVLSAQGRSCSEANLFIPSSLSRQSSWLSMSLASCPAFPHTNLSPNPYVVRRVVGLRGPRTLERMFLPPSHLLLPSYYSFPLLQIYYSFFFFPGLALSAAAAPRTNINGESKPCTRTMTATCTEK